jgi:Mg-chelatase subunit ChlD
MKRVRAGNDYEVDLEDVQEMSDANGAMSSDEIEDTVLKSVLQKDKKAKDEGTLIGEAINQGMTAFNPDIMFENIVNNYAMAKKVYGETLIRLLSGYNPDYVERNIKIPEFKRELKKKLDEKIKELKDDKFLKKDMTISEEGLKLASLVMYVDELESMMAKGMFGEKVNKKTSHYGERGDSRNYRKGDRYKDVAIKDSLKLAIRRGHKTILTEDLKTSQRQSKGQIQMIYALDASGSMKGKKIEMSKKAGVALSYKAIEAKDKVGLIVFGSEIKEEIMPTDDFPLLLKEITKIKASRQTDFKGMLAKAMELFSPGDFTKHLLILTDAMPTVGEDPEKESLEEVSKLKAAGITVSMIGINLDEKAKDFAEKLAQVGDGKLYVVREVEELDKIVLEDYYSVA